MSPFSGQDGPLRRIWSDPDLIARHFGAISADASWQLGSLA